MNASIFDNKHQKREAAQERKTSITYKKPQALLSLHNARKEGQKVVVTENEAANQSENVVKNF